MVLTAPLRSTNNGNIGGNKVKLREILSGKKDIRVAEYEKFGGTLIFIGGCYYNGKSLFPLDGGVYPIEMEVAAAKWIDNKTLMIVR